MVDVPELNKAAADVRLPPALHRPLISAFGILTVCGLFHASGGERVISSERMRRSSMFVLMAAGLIVSCSLFVDTENLGGQGASPDGGGAPPDVVEPATQDGGGGAESSTCAADLRSDGKNCGACGHDCLGGTCVDAKCQPGFFASIGGAPWYMTHDENALYVITLNSQPNPTSGKIVRIDKATRQIVVLAEGIVPAPFDVQVDAEYIYWTESFDTPTGKVRRRSKDITKTDVITLATVGFCNEIAVVPSLDRLFVSGWESAKVFSLSRSGGLVTEITDGGMYRAEGIAYDGTNVFVATSNAAAAPRRQIVRIDPASGAAVVSHPAPGAWGRRIAVAGDYILGVAEMNLNVVKKADGSIPRSFSVPADSFPGAVIYDDHAKAAYLANAGGNAIYRTQGPDFLTLEPLVVNQSRPVALAADAKAIYWTQSNAGTIGVLAK